MWAEAVMLQVERVRQIRRKADADSRAYERMEDWSPTELDPARNFRAQWAEEQTLVGQLIRLHDGLGVCRRSEARSRRPATRYWPTFGTPFDTSMRQHSTAVMPGLETRAGP
jgi:hypothetical protein